MGAANLGRSKQAVAAYSKPVELAKRLLKRDPNHREALRLITESLGSRGELEGLSMGSSRPGWRLSPKPPDTPDGSSAKPTQPNPKDLRAYLSIQTRRAERMAGPASIRTALESLAIVERLRLSDPGIYRYQRLLTN